MTHDRQLSIGSLKLANNLLLAPMAGITNYPVRLLARDEGAALCFTEMVSVDGLVRDGRKSLDLLRSGPGDRPLGMQLFGHDPALLAEGARMADDYGDLIDINMGCPVKKVVGGGAGSSLLREPGLVREIVRAVRRATRLPLTVKIRSGWAADSINYREIGAIVAGEGADAITLHPRTRVQMFEGRSDWSHLADLKRSLAIPVLGSGDLFTPEDVVAMLDQTGCDGVMIARGGLGNPWLFRNALALLRGEPTREPDRQERLAVVRRHLELFVATAGERVAVREMRKHLCWYVRGLPGAAQFRAAVNRLESRSGLETAMDEFFRQEP
jgi:nifR3 family TIM-barrel protein